MPVTLEENRELEDSLEVEFAGPGDISMATRIYGVVATLEDGSAPEVDDVTEAVYGSGGSFRGKRILRDDGQPSTLLNRFVMRSARIARMGAPNNFRVIEKYTTLWPFAEGAQGVYVKVNRAPAERTIHRYRAGEVTIPTGFTPDGLVDIGGTKVDYNGEPWQVLCPQQKITVDVARDFALPEDPDDPETRLYTEQADFWQDWADRQFVRNDRPIFGLPTGSVLYMGPGHSQVHHEFKVFTHTFLYDKFGHLHQRMLAAPDGKPVYEAGETVDGIPILHAKTVVWYQEFLDLEDLLPALFSGDEIEFLAQGFVNYPAPP